MSVVAGVGDLAPGQVRAYRVDGVAIVLVRDTDGQFHALDELCTHEDVSLAEGEVSDCRIECWLHGSVFDLRSGAPLTLPATESVNVYPVWTDGQDVLVDVSAHRKQP